MGRAIIMSNVGGGLYKARPLYDLAPLDAELSAIDAEDVRYSALLIRAFNSLALLRRDTDDAASAKNLVIQQWLDEVISKTNPVPPVIPPPIENDPETGEPWVDPDRAQEEPLLDLINALRTTASLPTLTRDDDLDTAALTHLRNQAGTNRIGHFGAFQSKPADRVLQQGYHAESVIEVLSYGATSPDYVVGEWQKSPDTVADLLAATATAAGVAYKYAATHPHTHLWCVLIVEPGVGPLPTTTAEYPPDPPTQQAENNEKGLERIELPRHDPDVPPKLGEAVQKYAIAANKQAAAEREIEKMMAAKLARSARKAELESIRSDLAALRYDVWASFFNDEIPDGSEVYTAEVPGYFPDDATPMSSVIYEGIQDRERTVYYTERKWNIVLRFDGFASKLRPTITMNPNSAYYDCAIEPGQLKWKPAWRYGVITSKSGDICSVSLHNETERNGNTLENPEFPINQFTALDSVPINYPPCNGSAFTTGDEVLVRFVGFDWASPEVVGFRRVPKKCTGGSWAQFR